MTPTQTGMAVAAVLVITGLTFGFGWFIVLAIAMAIGALVGRYAEGKFDPSNLIAVVSGKRSSS